MPLTNTEATTFLTINGHSPSAVNADRCYDFAASNVRDVLAVYQPISCAALLGLTAERFEVRFAVQTREDVMLNWSPDFRHGFDTAFA